MRRLLIILILCHNLIIFGQDHHSISAKGKAFKADSIRLRWSPHDAISWRYCLDKGYQIERYTIKRNHKLLSTAEISLQTEVNKQPLTQWQETSVKDKFQVLAAQAIFGNRFEITKISDIHSDLEQRYSFSLLAADFSYETALLSGLAYTDRNIEYGSTYVYRINCKSTFSEINIDSTWIRVSPDELNPLPKPIGLDAVWSDSLVSINWNRKILKSIYNRYNLFKSANGIEYIPIETFASINFIDKEGNQYYIDTVKNVTDELYYKIRGSNIFGELGPFSEPIKVSPPIIIQNLPQIIDHNLEKGDVTLILDDTIVTNDILKVEGSKSIKGPYDELEVKFYGTKNLLVRNPSEFTFLRCAKGDRYSLPYFINYLDSIPPNPPADIDINFEEGKGIVMNWSSNSEDDLLGYRVFKKLKRKGQLFEVVGHIITDTLFVDTTEYQFNGDTLFYTIIAEDRRHNRSGQSSVIHFTLPDRTPPPSPSFHNISQMKSGILLEWKNPDIRQSFSTFLYRRSLNESTWKLISVFPSRRESFLDTLLDKSIMYYYTLVNIDPFYNESEPIEPIGLTFIPEQVVPHVNSLKANVNRKAKTISLKWIHIAEAKEYHIYRNINGGVLRLYQQIKKNHFEDSNLRRKTQYGYAIKVIDKEGNSSKLCETVTVKY